MQLRFSRWHKRFLYLFFYSIGIVGGTAMSSFEEVELKAKQLYPKRDALKVPYGTAGFRMR